MSSRVMPCNGSRGWETGVGIKFISVKFSALRVGVSITKDSALRFNEIAQFIHNPDHAFGVLTTINFQLAPHFLAFSFGYVRECHPQKFPARRAALLDFQIFVASSRDGRQHGFD